MGAEKMHYELIRGFVERGVCPSNAELAESLGNLAQFDDMVHSRPGNLNGEDKYSGHKVV